MRTFLLLTLTCLTLAFATTGQTTKKTILAIFPHPDDENMIGPVLAKYSRIGHNVYVIIATDGKDGTRVTKIPSGDSLGLLRQQESICACEKLKINPPIYLHIDHVYRNDIVGFAEVKEMTFERFSNLNSEEQEKEINLLMK